ncbi:MAG: GNAT family N-acetyltransferase [Salinivirgaceae bacterium]|nr:GNAT family N-acetyltransferase [Salinivirgaceae bacterium]
MEIITEKRNNFTLTTDRTKMDVSAIHHFLAKESYWSKNIPLERVKIAVENSLNFGIFLNEQQVGYARVISDFSTIAYLGDVFILDGFRGQGLSKWLMDKIMAHPNLQGLRRWILLTGDAHELYKRYGWTNIASPDKWMEKHNPEVYKYI